MKPIRKIYEMKAASLEENCIKGPANVMGILDRGYDVTFPGFFKSALKGFLQNGFVAVGHDWSALPVAMPKVAKEQGQELYTEALFHSTEEGQDARTVCMERMANGLSVGLSVGFFPDYEKGVQYFDNGAQLLRFAEESGCDMSLFDAKGIRACKTMCRGLLPGGCKELAEYSIVAMPMNQMSLATEAKGATGDEEDEIDEVTTERELERRLREAGFSKRLAVGISLHGFKAFQRDADESEEAIPEEVKAAEETPETPASDEVAEQATIKAAALRQRHLALRHEMLSAGLSA